MFLKNKTSKNKKKLLVSQLLQKLQQQQLQHKLFLLNQLHQLHKKLQRISKFIQINTIKKIIPQAKITI